MFINEKDEDFGKQIFADFSLADKSVDITNTNNKKM